MRVYFDNAAATRPHPKVVEKMLPFLTEEFGNASSVHSFGRKARVAVEEAREILADLINADASEIYFCSGGTEANNFALFGIARTQFAETGKNKIITSKAEHHSVLESCEKLEAEGFSVTYSDVNPDSSLDTNSFANLIDDDISLVSLIHANNETGAVSDIEQISSLKDNHPFILHCDAVQSFGKIPLDVKKTGADAVSFSAHKIYGPKGAGALYVKSGSPISPIIFGGSQERNRRGGTENVAAIAGFAEAVRIAKNEMNDNYNYVNSIFEEFKKGIISLGIEGVRLNCSPGQLPYVLSVTFDSNYFNNDSEAMLIYLDINGVAASNGSACASGTLKPSHVIAAMGVSEENAKGTIRFSFGRNNTIEEVHYAIDVLKNFAVKFRK